MRRRDCCCLAPSRFCLCVRLFVPGVCVYACVCLCLCVCVRMRVRVMMGWPTSTVPSPHQASDDDLRRRLQYQLSVATRSLALTPCAVVGYDPLTADAVEAAARVGGGALPLHQRDQYHIAMALFDGAPNFGDDLGA